MAKVENDTTHKCLMDSSKQKEKGVGKFVLDRVSMHEEDSEYDACWEVQDAWQRGLGPRGGGKTMS